MSAFIEEWCMHNIYVIKKLQVGKDGVIYLMVFYIYVSLGFMPFIKFSTLPAAKVKQKQM